MKDQYIGNNNPESDGGTLGVGDLESDEAVIKCEGGDLRIVLISLSRLCRKKGEKKKRAEKGRLKKPPFIFFLQKKGASEKKNTKGEKRA